MKTPTYTEVFAAYKRNDLRPRSGTVQPGSQRRCCALGALADGMARTLEDAAATAGMEPMFALAFAYGFDDGFREGYEPSISNSPDAYEAGFNVGRAIFADFDKGRL